MFDFKEVEDERKSMQSKRKKREEAKKAKFLQKPKMPSLADNQQEPHMLTRQVSLCITHFVPILNF